MSDEQFPAVVCYDRARNSSETDGVMRFFEAVLPFPWILGKGVTVWVREASSQRHALVRRTVTGIRDGESCFSVQFEGGCAPVEKNGGGEPFVFLCKNPDGLARYVQERPHLLEKKPR